MKTPLTVILAMAAPVLTARADDHAGNYSSSTSSVTGWLGGAHRGDVNDGDWSFESAANGGSVGRFIGDSSLIGGNINTGGKAFGIYAHPSSGSPFYAARKTFAKPALTTGDTIAFRLSVDFRNGSKGFNLRDTGDNSIWTFNVGRVDGTNGGYYIRNGSAANGAPYDNGQQFGAYHSNTVFTFTFTQRERALDWTVVRSGGISAAVGGSAPIESGNMGSVRFFISGTDPGGLPANNLYFNDFTFQTAPRGDLPLTLGERRLPGRTPSSILRFSDPLATTVTLRHRGDDFTQDHALAKTGDVWEIDVSTIPLGPGWHDFKLRLNGNWESGANRWLWINPGGQIAQPPAVYLTWTRDPHSTITVHWHNDDPAANTLRHRPAGSSVEWTPLAAASTTGFPHIERQIHTAEITGLDPAAEYEFEADGYTGTFRFRTMPATLTEPLLFGVGGDVDIGPTADAMTAAAAAKDPAFLVVGGDIAYADGRAENFWKWLRYFESWHRNARAPDGRLIPKVVAIGNHEVRNGYGQNHPDFDGTPAWRLRCAPYFYRCFAFPGTSGHGLLDFGDYLSLIVLDTDHSTRTVDQNSWLQASLNARRTRTHLIPVYHVPAWPSHRPLSDEFSVRVRENWVPLFEAAGVHLAFEHHDHTYKRTRPLLGGQTNPDGIVYLGDGLWGIGSRSPDTSRWYLEPGASSRHHVHLVTLTATGRSIRALDSAGNLIGGSAPDHILSEQTADGIPAIPGGLHAARLRPRSVRLAWTAVANATGYEISRDGTVLGNTNTASFTDTARAPGSAASYTIRAVNRSGVSEPGAALQITHPPETVPPFVLDGGDEDSGYLLASPGMTLHAALRGDDLYVATWTPAGGNADHFVFLTDSPLPAATAPAPWAKAGLTAHPPGQPYLASESTVPHIAWSDAPASSTAFRAAAAGGRMEGVIDLIESFGAHPGKIHLASVAWQTADGGALTAQAPAGNGDGNLDPSEFLEIPLSALRDSTGTGVFDRADPARSFRATPLPGEGFTIRWTAIPGKRYQLWRSVTLAEDSWTRVHPEPLTASSGAHEMSLTDTDAAELDRAFYRVEILAP